MPSTFFGLNIARSGMSTYNAGLTTTAHNIANVKTPGYSKQVVNQSATQPISLGTTYGMVGSGVEAVSIESERDVYYDSKYRISNSSYGKYETASYYMQSIEDYLYAKDTSSGGMTNSLDDFFKSLISLSEDASNTTVRKEVVGYADVLTQYIQEAAYNLQNLQKEVNNQIASTVDQINAYAEEIASLNKQINTLEVYGSKANDLRDQRAYILDQLSELVDITVTEKEPAGGKGYNQFIVTIGSAVLVDTYDTNRILYEARDTYDSQNDIDSLYTLKWSYGQEFGIHETGLGGKLQALFELRDGNNGEVFQGTAVGGAAGDTKLVVKGTSEIATSLFKLDIPAGDGVLNVNNMRYEYDSFDVKVEADGTYTYTFNLKKETPLGKSVDGLNVSIGDEVDFRGIPYYMSQLNEFIRKFSYEFNQVQAAGFDMKDGDAGKQMFIAVDKVSGKELNFDVPDFENGFTFSSACKRDGSTGELELTADGYAQASYYTLTALNTSVDSMIVKDGRLLACSSDHDGVSNGENLINMMKLEDDKTMFRQGQPASFLQVLTSTVGVDSQKVSTAAENAENIKNAVDNRRLSKAGVDEDEEGQNLIICQNLLNYQYKVLSVMNEVLDKLINGTAV